MRSDEEALALVRSKAASMRRRRATTAVSGGAVVLALLVFVALAAQPSNDRTVDLASGADGSTTTVDTSTTSTSDPSSPTDPAEPSTAGGPGTTAAPKVAAPLRIEAVLLDERPLLDSEIHFRLTITDGDGSLTGLVAQPSGVITQLGTFPSCGQPGPSSLTMDVAVPVTFWDVQTFNERRRNAGSMPAEPTREISVEFIAASRSGCAGDESAQTTSKVTLGLGNGPAEPWPVYVVEAKGVDAVSRQARAVMHTGDCDGILDRIEIDWGDGTGISSAPVGRYGCNDSPVSPSDDAAHDYAAPGTYTVTAIAVSIDDRGALEQRSTPTTVEVTVPRPDEGG